MRHLNNKRRATKAYRIGWVVGFYTCFTLMGPALFLMLFMVIDKPLYLNYIAATLWGLTMLYITRKKQVKKLTSNFKKIALNNEQK